VFCSSMKKKRIIRFFSWFLGGILSVVLLFSVGLYIFKDEIIDSLLQYANQRLKTKVAVEKVDIAFWSTFPNVSVDFYHVFVQDTYQYATEFDTLFYSEKMRFRFNPIDIYKKDYRLKRVDILPGILHVKIDSLGVSNYDMLQSSPDSTSASVDIDLQKITLKNMRFLVSDRQHDYQHVTHLTETELIGDFSQQLFTLHAKSNLVVRQLKKGQIQFITDKNVDLDVKLQIDQKTQTIHIPLSTIQLANLPFEINGIIASESSKLSITTHQLQLVELVNNFTFDELQPLVTYQGKGTAQFALTIENANNNTSIACQFGIKDGQLYEPSLGTQLSDIHLNGHYSSRHGNDLLELKNVRFKTKAGPFHGSLNVVEFHAPIVKGQAHGTVDMLAAHQLFRFPSIERVEGIVNVDAQFHLQFVNTHNINVYRCQGSLLFDNNSLQLTNDKRIIHHINGQIDLHDNQIDLQDITANIGRSDIALHGKVMNATQKRNDDTKKIHVSGTLKSKQFYIEDFYSITTPDTTQIETINIKLPQFISAINGNVSVNIGKIVHPNFSTQQLIGTVRIDNNKLTIDRVSIAEVNYQNHRFQQIKGQIVVENDRLAINDIQLLSWQSTVQGSLQIYPSSHNSFVASGTLNLNDVPIRQLFSDWNNFSQDVITSSNISGRADAKVRFQIPIDAQQNIRTEDIQADIQVKIRDGRLKNVELLGDIIQNINTPATKLVIGATNIQHFGEQLADLTFKTLENTIRIEKGIIHVPQMTIHSSALNLTLNGQHGFDKKINYQFSFRLRDIKKKKTSEFGDIIDDKTGITLYLKMYGTTDQPQFAWNKTAQREEAKKHKEIEKQTLKSMMKSEFGAFKNDTSVHNYQSPQKNKEIIQIETELENDNTQTGEKKGKINKLLKNLEEENRKQEKIEIEWE